MLSRPSGQSPSSLARFKSMSNLLDEIRGGDFEPLLIFEDEPPFPPDEWDAPAERSGYTIVPIDPDNPPETGKLVMNPQDIGQLLDRWRKALRNPVVARLNQEFKRQYIKELERSHFER